MRRELQFLLALLVSYVFSLPVEPNVEESVNKVDHDYAGDYKDPGSVEKTGLDDGKQTANEQQVIALPVNIAQNITPKQISWLLSPLAQKIQFSPQSFLQEHLAKLKETLTLLGQQPNITAKQFPNNLLHLVGITDPDYYANRLDPAGFFKGNGWFANKGGLLGGPGAIFSTGSLLTDYPTAYRKK